MDVAAGSVFVPRTGETAAMLLDATLLERAFMELRVELRRRSALVWVPLQGILRMLRIEVPS